MILIECFEQCLAHSICYINAIIILIAIICNTPESALGNTKKKKKGLLKNGYHQSSQDSLMTITIVS